MLINKKNDTSQTLINSEDLEIVPNKFTVKGGFKKKGFSIDYS